MNVCSCLFVRGGRKEGGGMRGEEEREGIRGEGNEERKEGSRERGWEVRLRSNQELLDASHHEITGCRIVKHLGVSHHTVIILDQCNY